MSVSDSFKHALPEEDAAARHPRLRAAGAGPPPLVAHPSVHGRGRVAASGASAGEASRSRPRPEQHLLPREGARGQVHGRL